MSETSERITSAQAEIARQVLHDGNRQVEGTLQMIFGESPRQLDLHTRMLPTNEIREYFGSSPLITVKIDYSGDLKGVFLLLQNESEFARLRTSLQLALGQPVKTTNEETDYLVPDWLQDRLAHSGDEEKIRDALGELGNVLLGSYLTAVYSRCALATFQSLPETKMPDKKQQWLHQALSSLEASAGRAFLVDVMCAVRGETFRFYLLNLIERESVLALLKNLRQR